jgi:hypothetical protein
MPNPFREGPRSGSSLVTLGGVEDGPRRMGAVTRRAALALLPWLCLAAAGPGCSPAGPTSNGAAGTTDRLEKMRTLRGTGDPRRRGRRSSLPARQKP